MEQMDLFDKDTLDELTIKPEVLGTITEEEVEELVQLNEREHALIEVVNQLVDQKAKVSRAKSKWWKAIQEKYEITEKDCHVNTDTRQIRKGIV